MKFILLDKLLRKKQHNKNKHKMGGFPEAAENIIGIVDDDEQAEHTENCSTKNCLTNVIKCFDRYIETIAILSMEFSDKTPEQREAVYNEIVTIASCRDDYEKLRNSPECETCEDIFQAACFKIMYAVLAFQEEVGNTGSDDEGNLFYERLIEFLKNTFDGIIPDDTDPSDSSDSSDSE